MTATVRRHVVVATACRRCRTWFCRGSRFYDRGVIYCLRVLAHLHSIDSKSLWPDLRGTCPATVTSAAKLPPPRDNRGCLTIEEVEEELFEGRGAIELRRVATFIRDELLGGGEHFS